MREDRFRVHDDTLEFPGPGHYRPVPTEHVLSTHGTPAAFGFGRSREGRFGGKDPFVTAGALGPVAGACVCVYVYSHPPASPAPLSCRVQRRTACAWTRADVHGMCPACWSV